MSSFKTERVASDSDWSHWKVSGDTKHGSRCPLLLENLLLRAGMAQLGAASKAYYYHLNLSEMARIWKGGCIIRAGFLGKIQCFSTQICQMLLAPEFKQTILVADGLARSASGSSSWIPVPAFSASLDYFDSYQRRKISLKPSATTSVPYLRAR